MKRVLWPVGADETERALAAESEEQSGRVVTWVASP